MSLGQGPPDYQQQDEGLKQLQIMLGLLPWGPMGPVITINPPPILDPVVTNVIQHGFSLRGQAIAARIEILKTGLSLRKSMGLPPCREFTDEILSVQDSIIRLSRDMGKGNAA
jgi:hypothetical protein